MSWLHICLCVHHMPVLSTYNNTTNAVWQPRDSSLVKIQLHSLSTATPNACILYLVTGSIARSANLPVFSLLRGRFWGFSPRRGDTLHRWGWNLACRRGPPCQISPPSVQRQGCRTPKLKFLLRFDQNVEYKRPTGAYPLRDFHKICRVCNTFQDALGVKIWLDLLKGLWSYGGFKLRGSGFPQIFIAP